MSEKKSSCSIVFIGEDIEWMHGIERGVKRFFILESRHTEQLWGLDALLEQARPDIVILTGATEAQQMEKLRPVVMKCRPPVPVIVADLRPDGLDKWIRQGAEYAVARVDILSAIKNIQQIMRKRDQNQETQRMQVHYNAVSERFERLFKSLPDPICYVQDGLFINANPAFYKTFDVENEAELQELTLMNFVPRKSERALKELLKNALIKDLVPSEQIEMQTMDDKRLEMQVSVSQVIINEEKTIQVYLRDSTSGGGSGSGIDAATGLSSARILAASIRQAQTQAKDGAKLGYWVYLLLENYREVLQKDGLGAAEILMAATAKNTQRFLPASTEAVRFTDDALALWIDGDKEEVIKRINNLVKRLDTIVPDDIGRLIHPITFAGMYEIRKETTYEELVSKSYRAVRALVVGQSSERVAEPLSGDLSRNDERRIAEVQKILDGRRLRVWYQPISMLEPDGTPRFAESLRLSEAETEEDEIQTELESLLQVADRFGLARQIDRVKINIFLQDILSYDGDQSAIQCYFRISTDSLSDKTFAQWVENELSQTGIAPSQIVFEISVDALTAAYSGATQLIERLRPLGARFALADIGRLDDELLDLLERMKPEVLKLDIREIDTFEDEEETRFMDAIKGYAEANNATIIAAEMESPAQLSRVWPYDIQFLQGDGMVAAVEDFRFNFNEPLF